MRVLLLGKDGQLGWELQRALALLGDLRACDRASADFENLNGLRAAVRDASPNIIVNAAAYTAVDKAESEPNRARLINSEAVGVLAEEASRLGALLVHYSTDYVFEGTKATAYVEDDEPRPLSVYGETKLCGEHAIRDRHELHLIFRTSWVFGIRGNNFAKTMLRLALEKEELRVVADQHGAPTSAELLADATALALAKVWASGAADRRLCGTYHVAASGSTNWRDYAVHVIDRAGDIGMQFKTRAERVLSISAAEYGAAAKRPANSRLDTSKFQATFNLQLPHWTYHVNRLVDEVAAMGTL